MQTTPLPFALSTMLPVRLERATLIIEAVAREEPDDGLAAEADYQATAEIASLFVHAIQHRILTRAFLPLDTNIASPLKQTWEPQLPGWRFEFSVTELDTSALRVLLAMLVQSHHAFEPLARVTLTTDSPVAPVQEFGTALSTGPGFPRRPAPLPFELDPPDEDAWPEPGERYSIGFEWVRAIPAEESEWFREGLNVWDHLLVLGAFNQDYEEVGELEDMGDIVSETTHRIRHDAVKAGADHTEFYALLNLACAAHASGTPLEAIRIEL